MIARIREKIKELVLTESSSTKLAYSFCVGVYIAFSPFIFFHTAMSIGLSWLLGLNFPATFLANCCINNPWTMIPIYSSDYFFGEFILHNLLGITTADLNPAWMAWINEPLARYCGLNGVSFWSFMLGGNLLGLLIGGMLYPIMKRVFYRIATARHGVQPLS